MKTETRQRILYTLVAVLLTLCIVEGVVILTRASSDDTSRIAMAYRTDGLDGIPANTDELKNQLQELLDRKDIGALADRLHDEPFLGELHNLREEALESLRSQGIEGGAGVDEEIARIEKETERIRDDLKRSLSRTLKMRSWRGPDRERRVEKSRRGHRHGGTELEVLERDEADALVLVLKAPGLRYDTLEVEVDEETITFRGERSATKRAGEEDRTPIRYRHRTRQFTRTVPTPAGVDASSAEIDVDGAAKEIRIRFPKERI